MVDRAAKNDKKLLKIVKGKGDLVRDWLTWADRDYIAARSLLLEGLLVQGASFATTAIEKYLKASLACQGRTVKHGHNPLILYKQVKEDSSLNLDEEFLALLARAYEMRYSDDLVTGYNIVLSQALILDALDRCVNLIKERIDLRHSNGSAFKGLLESWIERKEPRIISKNTALGTVTRDALLNSESHVYEFRVLQELSFLEAPYKVQRIEDTHFNSQGLEQTSADTFKLTNTPM